VFLEILRALAGEASGPRALDTVAEIIRHHRIQASPGFRDAARALARRLEQAGLQVEIMSFPADGEHRYWSYRPGLEWACTDAELTLLSPERRRLARWSDAKLSLVQRSAPTPPEGTECRLVLVEPGDDPAAYRNLDLAGKAVMTDGDLELVRRLVVAHGGIGLVTDGMREFPPVRMRWDLADALQYTSFWWGPGDRPIWGFVLSPRAGGELRKMLRDAGPAGLPVRARVAARFYPGTMDVLSAVLPGNVPDEEVVVIAHLCHPQPSANDNASGAAAAVEAMVGLAALVREGTLSAPRRAIRLLLVPEINGTTCYLASTPQARQQIVAAVNLDMVGERQDLCGSVLQVEAGPLATPSFATDLLCLIMAESLAEGSNWGGTAALPAMRWTETPFSGGSDHYLLGDPTVGVPCPMIIQWPDRFYHTSADTLDKVDPEALRRVAVAAGTYAMFLATAGLAEACWLAGEMVARFAHSLHAAVSQWAKGTAASAAGPGPAPFERLEELIAFRLDRRLADLASLDRLLTPEERRFFRPVRAALEEECRQVAEREKRRTAMLAEITHSGRPAPSTRPQEGPGAVAWGGDRDARADAERQAQLLVPRRLVPGPVDLRDALGSLPAPDALDFLLFRREHKRAAEPLEPRLLYWSDGQRTLAEVERLVELEVGVRDTPYALRYVKLLERAGLLELTEVTTPGGPGGKSLRTDTPAHEAGGL
jgi:hypothetical protein